MIKQMWKLCFSQKKNVDNDEEEPIYSYQENNYFENIYEDDNLQLEELNKEQRIRNMCRRWKIYPDQALYLINLVDMQQT